jgi:hypothetical protein
MLRCYSISLCSLLRDHARSGAAREETAAGVAARAAAEARSVLQVVGPGGSGGGWEAARESEWCWVTGGAPVAANAVRIVGGFGEVYWRIGLNVERDVLFEVGPGGLIFSLDDNSLLLRAREIFTSRVGCSEVLG